MSNFTSPTTRGIKDIFFVYVIGSSIQRRMGARGISAFHLNKAISLVMRHWVILSKYKKYKSLHIWDLQHFPHRFGERIYRKMAIKTPSGSMHDEIQYLEDIVDVDRQLRKLDVVRKTSGDENEVLFFFPTSDSLALNSHRKRIKVPDLDYNLIIRLAEIYSNIQITEIAPLSTCPTEADALAALFAQLNIWHEEMEELEKLTDPSRFARYFASDGIPNSLKYAFACGEQMNVKIDWFEGAHGAAHRTYGTLYSKGYRGLEIEVIKRMVGSSSASTRVESFREIKDVLSVTVGHVIELLAVAGCRVDLTGGQKDWIAKNKNKITKIGLTVEQADSFISDLNDRLDTDLKPYVAPRIQHIIRLTRDYLRRKHLMIHSDGSAKLSPAKLVP